MTAPAPEIIAEGRESLLRGPAGPEGQKRLSWKPRVSKARYHPFIKRPLALNPKP